MRAAVRTRYGPPEVVGITDVDEPTVGDHDVLVKVHASTVNRTDCGFRSGEPPVVRLFAGFPRPRAKVLGNEFAGEIEAVGHRVTAFAVGDRVFGYDDTRFGAHAEYLAVREDASLTTMPAGATYDDAAPITEGSHYALAFIRKARIRSGQHILVNGATGAIGSAAVQLVVRLGAEVTAVCDTGDLGLVEDLGAARVIDARSVDFTQDHQSYDAVLDCVGTSSFGRCRRLLVPRGRYLSSELGRLSQNPLLSIATPLLGGKRVVFPFPRHDQAMVRQLKELVESGAFRPLVDRRYPLDRIVEAYRYVETGRKLGNVVITVVASDG